MEVKIYREPENLGLILNEEELAEYQKLANELGIPDLKIDKTPSIYQVLNQFQIRALEALCPGHVDLANYNRSTIPVEVLKVIKFINDNEMFDYIKVWYDDKNPDPLIIGEKYRNNSDREKKYTWNTEKTLIARWGDCAYELNELVEMGKKRLQQEFTEKAIDIKNQIQAFLEYPEVYTNKYLSTGRLNFPSN